MIKTVGAFGNKKLLIERYSEFMELLKKAGDNVAYVGVETHNWTTYFYIVLKNK